METEIDLTFIVWIITCAFLSIILVGFCCAVMRKISAMEKKLNQMQDNLFQIALLGKFPTVGLPTQAKLVEQKPRRTRRKKETEATP